MLRKNFFILKKGINGNMQPNKEIIMKVKNKRLWDDIRYKNIINNILNKIIIKFSCCIFTNS